LETMLRMHRLGVWLSLSGDCAEDSACGSALLRFMDPGRQR